MNASDARTLKRRTAPHRAAASSKPPRKSKANPDLAPSRAPATPDQRQSMVAEAAYYYAEHRGFVAGYELNDWLAAEDQIDATLAVGDTATPCGA